MIQITSTRISPYIQKYRITFEGEGKVLLNLLDLLKIGRKWNRTAELEISPENIEDAIRTIQKGV